MKRILFILFLITQCTLMSQKLPCLDFVNQSKYSSDEIDKVPVIPLMMYNHMMTAKKADCLDACERFSLDKNEKKTIFFQMSNDEESNSAASSWATIKWISVASTAVLGGTSYYFNVQAQNNYDSYSNATKTTEALDYRQKSDDCRQMRDILLYAATGTATAAIFSWIMQIVQ